MSSDRNGRNGRNDRNHHGRHNDRDRHDRDGRNGRHGGNGNRRGRNDDVSTRNVIDGLFGSNYECIILADNKDQSKRAAEQCCERVDGTEYDVHGRCLLRDIMGNPREEWRNCALEQRGAEFADCYYREQREVDDLLDERDNNRKGRHHRDHDDKDNKRGHNDEGNRQFIFNEDNDDDDNNNGPYQPVECKVKDLDDGQQPDEEQQHAIEAIQNCCQRPDTQGRPIDNDQACELPDSFRKERFNQCLRSQHVNKNEVKCRRERD